MLLGAVPFTVFASDANTLEEINRENAAAYAVSFVDVVFENPGLESGDVIPFYDETDQLSGYCVDIVDDGQPNGYVIIKFSNGEQTVSEFAIEPGVKNPYDQMAEEKNVSLEDVTYYSVGPNDYQIVDTDSNVVYGFESEESTISQFQTMKQQVQFQQILNAEMVNLNGGSENYSTNALVHDVISDTYTGTVHSRGGLTGAGSATYCNQYTIQNTLGKTYACAVVALCNMMKYYYSRGRTNIDANLATMYDAIWNYAGTDSGGGTLASKIPGAAQQYLNSKGYSCSYNSFSIYSNFIYWIGENRPCIFAYTIGGSGHAVFVLGYVKTVNYNYLQVMDGWNSYSRYLNFSGYNYTAKYGYSFQA